MLKTISSILNPISCNQFHSEYYSKKPLIVEGFAEKFDSLFGWDALNRVLNTTPVPHPTMKLVLEGKQITPTDAKGIINRCREGASLVIEEMHKYDENVGNFAASLASEIGEPVRINMYLSQPSRQGYNRHYDTHDVFILQIAGYKGWRVYDDTLKFPLFVQKAHSSAAPETVRLEGMLKPGDVLYIPRGHWHEATAQIEPSLHLTVGLYARTGISFLSWLADELREDVNWRETFPLVFRSNGEALGEPFPETIEHFEKLKRLMTEKLDSESIVSDYQKYCIAQESVVKPFNFPSQTVGESFTDETVLVRPESQQVIIDRKSSHIEIIVWGKILKFSNPAEAILRTIFTSTEFTLQKLSETYGEISKEDIRTILTALLNEEIIKVIE